MYKFNVLFLCTGNSARSQMAEALVKKYAGGQVAAFSAGLEPAEINPYTRRVMQEIGLDLAGQYAKHVREYMGKMHFGFLITVCAHAEQNCPSVFPGVGQRQHWNLEDPAAFAGSDQEKLEKFRQVRDQIDQRVRGWLQEQGVNIMQAHFLRR